MQMKLTAKVMIILVNNKFFCRKFVLNHRTKLIFIYFFLMQYVLGPWRLN
jgi:hypothetical protein